MTIAEALSFSAAQAHPKDRKAQNRHIVRLMRAYGWGETVRKRHRRHMDRNKPKEPKMRPYKFVTGKPEMTKTPWYKRMFKRGGER